jgi:16S rRNA (guanine527-N7)-methyltransferase
VRASGPHQEPLASLHLAPATISSLETYLDVLTYWSGRVNLTGARTPPERVGLLVSPVLALAGFVEGGTLIDVGSGNGSPGLVLALVRPDLEVTLLEPRARRWAFLREACRATGRGDVRVLRARHDEYDGPPARTVTLRALSLPLAELCDLVEVGGRVVVLGSAPRPSPGFVTEGMPDRHRERFHSFRRVTVSRET